MPQFVAQMVEQLLLTADVCSSNPVNDKKCRTCFNTIEKANIKKKKAGNHPF